MSIRIGDRCAVACLDAHAVHLDRAGCRHQIGVPRGIKE
jgi:hypothetical protein